MITSLAGQQSLYMGLTAAQKVEKKLRRLRNAGEANEQDVTDAKAAVDLYRELCRRHGLPVIDLDSRAERKKRKGS